MGLHFSGSAPCLVFGLSFALLPREKPFLVLLTCLHVGMHYMLICRYALHAQSCLTLRHHRLYPSGSSVHVIVLARILEWVAISFSRGSSWPGDWTRISCIAGGFFTAEPFHCYFSLILISVVVRDGETEMFSDLGLRLSHGQSLYNWGWGRGLMNDLAPPPELVLGFTGCLPFS